MVPDNSTESTFLYELYTLTNGDPAGQAATQDIGAALGLDENEAGEIAQNLCIKGLAELKTLSGGIGITRQGLKELNMAPGPGAAPADLTLGSDPVLGPDGLSAAEKMLNEIKTAMARTRQPYPETEEMVIDIKTMEVQMLSPKPKTIVIREVFRSLAQSLKDDGPDDLVEKLEGIVSS